RLIHIATRETRNSDELRLRDNASYPGEHDQHWHPVRDAHRRRPHGRARGRRPAHHPARRAPGRDHPDADTARPCPRWRLDGAERPPARIDREEVGAPDLEAVAASVDADADAAG